MNKFYEAVPISNTIEQGDIFENLPFLNLNSSKINEIIVEDREIKYKEIDLDSYVAGDEKRNIVVSTQIKPGIIISQNCDLARDEYVSFCAIRPFEQVEHNFSPVKKGKQVEFLTKEYEHKVKYFYLPSEMPNGFKERMAVDFSLIHQVKLDLLKQLLHKRKCKLNTLPREHFRIKLSHYFKRFAYNPWYVLNKEEFSIYKNTIKDASELTLIKPYDWNI